ncbi:GAF domain-containing protein [Zhouia sp. PK063]|uniref:GAF domain-containing protein n=1 Tax=Zhouia sp. PK063 TaxID=3373602 RepID=UPI0037B76A2E
MEKNRLKELKAYQILDTPAEAELDELAQIASIICNTPVSLITMLDENRQWFKSKHGLTIEETPRKDAFCNHALHTPDQVLVVKDAACDERFTDNTYVKNDPHIRFYAGAPLVTPAGNVLGTLCVIDVKPRKISKKQQEALQILAKRAMKFLNTRKLLLEQRNDINYNIEKLRKLTHHIPSTIFQLRRLPNKTLHYDYLSLGDFELPEGILLEYLLKNPQLGFNLIHTDDYEGFMQSLEQSYCYLTLWQFEYRIADQWFLVKAKPEREPNGDVIWYGIFQNITNQKSYEKAMKKMAFDISHVLRKPVANLIGLSDVITNKKNLRLDELKTYSNYIKLVSEELDKFTHDLNSSYEMHYNLMTHHHEKIKDCTVNETL